jgi:hypothetical protein
MPTFSQYDVVSVPFPYTDRAALERRPALVISKPGLDRGFDRLRRTGIMRPIQQRLAGADGTVDHLDRSARRPDPRLQAGQQPVSGADVLRDPVDIFSDPRAEELYRHAFG